jgi:hypothetical protein
MVEGANTGPIGGIVMRASPWTLFVLSLLLSAGAASAQQSSTQQTDSLAAAARRAREEKKDQAKPVRVWDNDNIPRKPDEITVLNGPESQATPANSSANATADGKSGAPAAKDSSASKKAGLEADLAAAKEALQTLQNDLDILKRKFVLDQQSYYGKPNYSTDKDGAAALSDEQSQIDAKQLEMGAAQQKITDLQAQLNALSEPKPPQQ